jgi:hypothetical protein
MTRLEKSSTKATYGRKIGTSGIRVPSKVFTYPPEDAIAKAVVEL